MKNKITLLAALLLCNFFTNAQIEYGDGSLQLRADRSYQWNTDSVSWDSKDSILYFYNNSGKLSRKERNKLASNQWTHYSDYFQLYNGAGNYTAIIDSDFIDPSARYRYDYSYDANQNNTLFERKRWGNNNWESVNRSQFTYNGSGKRTEELYQDYVNNAWVNIERYQYVYNGADQNTSETYESWDDATNQWTGEERRSYTYDANGGIQSSIIQNYNAATLSYVDANKTEYTRDASGNALTVNTFIWNTATNTWDKSYFFTYTYSSSGKLLTMLSQTWSTATNAWLNSSLNTTTYDANGWRVEETQELWTGTGWRGNSRNTYTYNANGYRTSFLYEIWNPSAQAWANNSGTDYWYEINPQATGITSLATSVNFTVYPNPVSGDVFFVKATTETSYQLFDVAGRILQEGNLQVGQNQIELGNTSKGIYFLRAGKSTMKLVKE